CLLVLFRNRSRHIDDRENCENKSLQNGDENMKCYENDGQKQRQDEECLPDRAELSEKQEQFQQQSEKNTVKQLTDEHVDPKSNGERQETGSITDDLNREHDRSHRQHWPKEMLPVSKRAVPSNAAPIVVHENHYGAPQGDRDLSSGRFKRRNNADEIAEKHEDADAAKHRNVPFSPMGDILVKQVADTDIHRVH